MSEIARGGMGAVYKVWDQQLRRHLALKVMLDRRSSAGTPSPGSALETRFLEEAQVTGQLDHPGVVPVHELGLDADGRRFFTMRLVKGRTLGTIIDLVHSGEERWTLTRALGVVLKVCEAMAFAHDKGVIHRDLKPANIMVGRFGETYVMDWGLAKVLDREGAPETGSADTHLTTLSIVHTERHDLAAQDPSSPLMTTAGDAVGTPSYMAPEQAEGHIEEVGPSADVYAVGALLYHLLAGRAPYVKPGTRVPAHTVLKWVIDGPPEPVRGFSPGVPDELVAICEKAMARDPAARYTGMLELAEDLQAYLEGHVVRAYQTGAMAEFRKWVGRNRALASTVLSALVLILAGTTTAALVLADKNQQVTSARDAALDSERAALANEQRAQENERLAQGFAAKALLQSYVANVGAAATSLRIGAADEARRRLAACDPSLRDWEWRHLSLRTDAALHVFEDHDAVLWEVAFSPDGELVASGGGDYFDWGGTDYGIRIWRAATGEILHVLEGHAKSVLTLGFSPDGRTLASGSLDDTLRLWDVASGEQRLLRRGFGGLINHVIFLPDGQGLAVSHATAQVDIVDARDGNRLHRFNCESFVRSLALSPDGRKLAAGLTTFSLLVWDLESRKLVHYFRARDEEPVQVGGRAFNGLMSLAFSPDGRTLVSGGSDKTVRIWDLEQDRLRTTLRGHRAAVGGVRYHPNGLWIVSGGMDNTVRFWDAASGNLLETLHGHDKMIPALDIDPLGRRIASGSWDGTVRLWDGQPGSTVTTIQGERNQSMHAHHLAFSPDGVRLAWRVRARVARVSDTRTGEALFTLAARPTEILALGFTPDGSRLYTAASADELRVWDASSGSLLQAVGNPLTALHRADFSPDCTLFASGNELRDAAGWSVTVRFTDTGERLHTLTGHSSIVDVIRFSPDGSRLVTISVDGTAIIWAPVTGERIQQLAIGTQVYRAAFSPDARTLVTAGWDTGDNLLAIWDVDRGVLSHSIAAKNVPTDVTFSPDGRRIVAGTMSGVVSLFDPEHGEVLGLQRHEAPVTRVAFSPDGARLASADQWGRLHVWETVPPAQRLEARMAALGRRRWTSQVEPLIASLSLEYEPEEVEARLRAEAGLDDEVRAEAIRLARNQIRSPPDWVQLNTDSWEVVAIPGLPPELYAQALEKAREAVALRPSSALVMNTLGVAQYRTGRFAEALDTLTRSDELNLLSDAPYSRAADLVFVAMCHHQLEQTEEARMVFKQVRELMGGETESDLILFMREAEALVAQAEGASSRQP